jgi:hypothetical protein
MIISNLPAQKSRLRALLQHLFGSRRGQSLEATQSEVWSVPESRLVGLMARLRQFGCKVTHLREDFNHILKRLERPHSMSPQQQARIDAVRSSRAAVAVGIMRAPEAEVAEYALTGEPAQPRAGAPPEESVSRLVLPINEKQQITIRRTRAVTRPKGTTWRGEVEESGESAVLMWWRDGHLSGVLGYRGHIYTIENMDGDIHAVIEYDPRNMPPDHAVATSDRSAAQADRAQQSEFAAAPLPKILPLADAELKALQGKQITIDLMMLYTKKSASQYICDPGDLLALGVEHVNQTFRNSGIENVSLRLVHTQMVDYEETVGDHFQHLYRMVDGVGPFKDVRKLRDEQHADVVGLVVDDPSGCGLSTRVGPEADEAYFVVHHSCASISMSIAHEMGHILGARHDRLIDANNAPFPYGHGYVNGKWRDIMSYERGCDGCLRIPFWSNPRISYKGEPTGTLSEDNARVILEQAERVSKFR